MRNDSMVRGRKLFLPTGVNPLQECDFMMRLAALILGAMVTGWCAVIGFAAAALPAAAPPAAVSPQDEEFFEKQVRPVLAQHCFSCHGAKSQTAGLRLDARADLLKGGAHGPVLVPGEPEQSALIRAIRYESAIKMPPAGKLPAEAITALTTWVKMGAPWPGAPVAAPKAAAAGSDPRKSHWSFQPIRMPRIPTVRNKAWPASPIDAFVLARLEQQGMKPSPGADRRTLIRRAYADLIGLPPTAAEVDAFLADRSPNAFAKVVDRLLASPRYGERWGRHWLDVARYADTKGYVLNDERRYPFAYTYRDYVIHAFNEDLPYNRFLVEQIAADRLPLGDDKQPLAAMGFLTLGRRYLNQQNEIIDDRIDVVTRGTMGLTVACARCHDHKFDPIPTADYYSLYGVFASSREPRDLPVLAASQSPAASRRYQKALQESQAAVDRFLAEKYTDLRTRARGQTGTYLLAAYDSGETPGDGRGNPIARDRDLSGTILRRWQTLLEETAKVHDPIFAPWHAFAALPAAEFAAKAPAVAAAIAANADAAKRVHPLVAQAFAGPPPAAMREVAERYGALFTAVEKEWQETLKARPEATALPDAEREALRQVLYGAKAPSEIAADEVERALMRVDRDKLQALRRKVDQVKISPDAPPQAMVLEDSPTPVTPRILLRGNRNSPGPEVPRQFLAVLSGEKRQPFKDGSGRLELARAIVDEKNPLTARVMVNRIWLYHFGAGLVRTPSDFGKRGEPPTHPELLDWLASEFMATNDGRPPTTDHRPPAGPDHSSAGRRSSVVGGRPSDPYACGWSIKKMHRLIMLSRTYQQSSGDNPRCAQLDPENRLLWRMNRQRLDLEGLRDALLAAAGQLDTTMGGPSVEITTAPYSTRRTVYGFIDRNNLQAMYRTFDLASPDTSNAQRFMTTVPQQALFMMNSPFVHEQARHLAARAAVGPTAKRIQQLYRLVYGRWAAPEELQIGLRYLNNPAVQAVEPPPREEQPWQYGYGEYDGATQRVTGFQALPHWTGAMWQGGKEYPDAELAHLRLTGSGGHPGKDRRHAAIRRWIAPVDGVVTVSGTLGHASPDGDGVQAYAVSSRTGEVGHWSAKTNRVETTAERVTVRKGDTLDFIVACGENPNSDAFTWAPVIQFGSAGARAGGVKEWSAEIDFRGPPAEPPPPLTAWERYAQILLLSNEFVFVD
jgi:Protein of unknown function (DUF1549)/Protein of unknown function (DUF1553)/Planctomycete cytochrome C